MADRKISDNDARTTIADTDVFPGVRSGDTTGSKWTGSTLKNILGGGVKSVANYATIAAAFADLSANETLYIPPGTYTVTASLTPPASANIIGAGIEETILSFEDVADVCLYAPGGGGMLDAFSIVGDATPIAGSIGIKADDDHTFYKNRWGKIKVRYMDKGVVLTPTTYNGFYFSHIDYLAIEECTTYGLQAESLGSSNYVNSNFIGSLMVDNCGTALYIRKAEALTIGHLSIQTCTTGINADTGGPLNIWGGAIEGCTTQFNIGSGWSGFRYMGEYAAGETQTFNGSVGVSSIIPYSTAQVNTFTLKGQWYFDELRCIKAAASKILNPPIYGATHPYTSISSGTTIDVTNYDTAYLTHGTPTTITAMTGDDYQIVTLFALSANITINDGGNFMLTANWTPGVRSNLTLWNAGSDEWWEIARSAV